MITLFNSALRIRKSPDSGSSAKVARRGPDGTPPPAAPPEAKPASNGDNGLSRLAKLAPSEVMTVYLAGKSAFSAPGQLPIFAGVMLVLCFLWRWSTTHEDGKPTQWLAIASASISFGLWVCASDGQTFFGPGFTPAMSGFIALLWTLLLAPMINKGD